MTLRIIQNLEQGTDPTKSRFLKFVSMTSPDECWEWQGDKHMRGYGKFWFEGKKDLAHRVSYRLFKGEIPNGNVVRHACDNKPCVNPHHLLTGSSMDNVRDAMERGLCPKGESNGRAKLTTDQVSEIRACWQSGESQVSMSKRFGVSRAAIQWILNGRSWKGMGEAA